MEQETKVRWSVTVIDCVCDAERCTHTITPLFNVGLTISTMTVPNSYIASHVPQNISDGY